MSEKITLTLPDGTPLEVPKGTTALEAAEEIGPGLAKAAVAAGIDGEGVDLTTPINEDGDFEVGAAPVGGRAFEEGGCPSFDVIQ